MFCTSCGRKLDDTDRFCRDCGRATPGSTGPAATPAASGRLVRIRNGKKIAGVCAGFARYLAVDVTVVRLITLLVAITTGIGFIAYIIAWIVMPLEDGVILLPPASSHPTTAQSADSQV